MALSFYSGTPRNDDQMWRVECASVERWCLPEAHGLDPGCGERTLYPSTVRVDMRPEVQPQHVADACALPFGDGEFDYVFTCHLLEHMRDPWAALREWLRVVRVGGHVATVIPNTWFTKAQNTDPTPHYFEWTPPEFARDVLRLSPTLLRTTPWYRMADARPDAPFEPLVLPPPLLDRTWYAQLVQFSEACPQWSFAVVLRKVAP